LDTAARFGILPEIIERARQAMTTREQDIARFLNELQQKLEAVGAREAAVSARMAELDAREKSLLAELEKREAQRVRDFESRTRKLLAEFEQNARTTIEQIKTGAEARKAADQAQLKAARLKREFQAEVAAAMRPEGKAETALEIKVGAKVKIENVREAAQVLRLLDNGRVEVQAGFMKMQIRREEIVEVVTGAAGGRKLPANVRFEPGPAWDTPTREINVIGQSADEAVENVDRFLDKASLASIARVRIIHGHGYGVLKRAVRELLQKHPHVARHYGATPAEGGTGATIAELRA
jgi:DNA mismatch repair protein MutS2